MITKIAIVTCLFLAACQGGTSTSTSVERIACHVTADCSARGGTCEADDECHADNECASDADCVAGTTCSPDPDFGGLCTAPNQVPAPAPAWSCATGKDCPAGQGCASDGACHVDGECHNTWQPDGTLAGDCTSGLLCAAPTADGLAGFCTDDRGGPNPYCRSTGTGACRMECVTDADCGDGTCVNKSCHRNDECQTAADCSPNHTCGLPDGWEDDGYQLCLADPNPTCVDDGQGACRLSCATDEDCFDGGGCRATDHLCHASNECHVDADCNDPTLVCYPSTEFGGLCGPTR